MPIANIRGLGLLLGLAEGAHALGKPIHAQPPWHRELLLSQAPAAVGLHANCQLVAEGWDVWSVDQRYAFRAGGQSCWLVVATCLDGASRLCLTRPGYAQGVLVTVSELQDQCIDRIFQVGSSGSFLVDHRSGQAT